MTLYFVSNGTFMKVKWLKLLILGILAAVAYSAAWSTPIENRVTEELLAEGNSIQQSTVDGLLTMIDLGFSWDKEDDWMAYHNLEYFRPFSLATVLKILNLIQKAATEGNTKVDVDRLMLYVFERPLRTTIETQRLQEVMRILPPSEAKRLAAVAMSTYSHLKMEAVAALYGMISSFSQNPTQQILTALNLIALGENVVEAESILLLHLQNPNHAGIVLFYTDNSILNKVTDRVLTAMEESLSSFNGQPRDELVKSIKDLRQSRRSALLNTSVCNSFLEENLFIED